VTVDEVNLKGYSDENLVSFFVIIG
jgi:hypothetical protein